MKAFVDVIMISYCHVCLHTLLVVPWMHHVCLTCCANPADVALFSLRHSEWKVNVCVSLSCDPVCIDVSLKVALPAASLCSAVTVLQYPVALKTLYLFRTHHVQDRQMVTTSTAQRRSIIACVY